MNKHSYYSYKIWLCPSLVPLGAFGSVNPGLCRKLWRHRERLADKVQTSRGQRGKREPLGTRLAASQCFSLWRADYTSRIGLVFRAGSICRDLGTLIKRNKWSEAQRLYTHSRPCVNRWNMEKKLFSEKAFFLIIKSGWLTHSSHYILSWLVSLS